MRRQREPMPPGRRLKGMKASLSVLGAAVAGVALAACGGPTTVTVDQPLADAAEIVCVPNELVVEPAAVRPQSDGVHVRVDNPGDDERMVLIDRWGYVPAPPGVTDLVLPIPPGELRLTCVEPLESDDPEEQAWPYPGEDEWATLPRLDVIDVDGLWADDILACEVSTGFHYDYEWEMTDAPMPAGRTGDPVDLAREDLPRELGELGEVRRGDVLEPAGYGGDTGRVRLVRDGEVVALIYYSPDGQGGWHVGGVEYCE